MNIEYREERLVDADVRVDAADRSLSQLHAALFESPRLHENLINAVRDAASEQTATEFRTMLSDTGVDALDGAYRELCVRIAKGDKRAVWDILDATRTLGQGRSPLDDIFGSAAEIFAVSDVTPTIEVRLGEGFTDADRSQQRDVVAYLVALAVGCDVALVGGGIERAYLGTHYREELPERVTKPPKTPLGKDSLKDIFADLGADSLPVELLRALADESGGTLSYTRLRGAFDVARTTISRALNERLVEHGLVDIYAGTEERHVEILDDGRRYLDYVAESVGTQDTLDSDVTETPQPCGNAVCKPAPAHEAAPPEDRRRLPHWHDVAYLSRSATVAAAATPPENGVSVTDHPVEPADDRAEAGWGYIPERDTLVVSAEYDNPMQHMVCIARALSNWRTWRAVLDDERLSELDALFESGKEILFGARCMGYLPNTLETPSEYAEALQQARDELLELTGTLSRGEFEMDEKAFRGVITREAMGLAGVMRHLLDLVGVEVVWEVRLPEYSRNFDEGRAATVSETIAKNAAIASTYGHHVAYRQLFEDREDKRKQNFTPSIDADDPVGNLLGRISVVGDFGSRRESFARTLRTHLRSPDELHEDAPGFRIAVPVRDYTPRRAYSEVVRRMCDAKDLDVTSDAVALFRGFARTPYDVAEAFGGLARESQPREIRAQEIRRALSTLSPDRLLEDAPPSVRKLVSALLRADEPLSATEWAEAAGVSTESVRRHRETLVAMGLVDDVDGAFRLHLSFTTDDERYDTIVPEFVRRETAVVRDVVFTTLEALDAGASLFEPWIDVGDDGIPDVSRLLGRVPWLQWALPLLRGLCGEDAPTTDHLIEFGGLPNQASIHSQTQEAAG